MPQPQTNKSTGPVYVGSALSTASHADTMTALSRLARIEQILRNPNSEVKVRLSQPNNESSSIFLESPTNVEDWLLSRTQFEFDRSHVGRHPEAIQFVLSMGSLAALGASILYTAAIGEGLFHLPFVFVAPTGAALISGSATVFASIVGARFRFEGTPIKDINRPVAISLRLGNNFVLDFGRAAREMIDRLHNFSGYWLYQGKSDGPDLRSRDRFFFFDPEKQKPVLFEFETYQDIPEVSKASERPTGTSKFQSALRRLNSLIPRRYPKPFDITRDVRYRDALQYLSDGHEGVFVTKSLFGNTLILVFHKPGLTKKPEILVFSPNNSNPNADNDLNITSGEFFSSWLRKGYFAELPSKITYEDLIIFKRNKRTDGIFNPESLERIRIKE